MPRTNHAECHTELLLSNLHTHTPVTHEDKNRKTILFSPNQSLKLKPKSYAYCDGCDCSCAFLYCCVGMYIHVFIRVCMCLCAIVFYCVDKYTYNIYTCARMNVCIYMLRILTHIDLRMHTIDATHWTTTLCFL